MFLLLFSLAFADGKQRVIYKEKTEIDFESVEIEGVVKKPNGQMVLERRKAEFNPLIELKEDFIYEISTSVSQIK